MSWESYSAFKQWLLPIVGLSRDAMHIHVGLAVFFLTVGLLQRRPDSWLPWTAAALAAFGGEAWDIYDRLAIGAEADPPAHWHDIWNTLFWPTMIALGTRLWRWREESRAKASADGGEQPLE